MCVIYCVCSLLQASQLGTRKIDEDGLLDLLRTRPGKRGCGSGKPTATTKQSQSRGTSKKGSGGLHTKSPPSATVAGGRGRGVATPTRNHVLTPVAMATPSPGAASSSAETPQPLKSGKL